MELRDWFCASTSFMLLAGGAIAAEEKACAIPDKVKAAVAAMIHKGANRESALIDAFLAASPRSGSFCPRNPIDRVDPESGHTLLTAALSTGNAETIDTVIKLVGKADGDLRARNAYGATAYDLARDEVVKNKNCSIARFLPQLASKLEDTRDLVRAHCNQDGKPPSFWDRIATGGTSDAVVPDILDNPRDIPPYVANLLGSTQGVSIGAKDQGGKSTPQVQGEIRYTLQRRSEVEDLRDRIFLFAGGNVNSNLDRSNPTNPDWLSAGIGLRYIHNLGRNYELSTQAPVLDDKPTYSWLEMTVKAGVLQNRIPIDSEYFRFANIAETYFSPIGPDDSPVYGAVTVGGQVQAKNGSSGVQSVPVSYLFGRLDLYAYPCFVLPGCVAAVRYLEMNPASVTFHLDWQAVNRDAGHLLDFSLNWEFRPKTTLGITRTNGHQDPLVSFGIPLQRAVQTLVQVRIRN